jgi:multidrug resistance protein, MATE family
MGKKDKKDRTEDSVVIAEEFSTYRSTTVDPSPWVLLGTLSLCGMLLGGAVIFLQHRRRRRKHKKNKQSSYHSDLSNAKEIAHTTFGESRLRGWNEIANSLNEGEAVKRKWKQSSPKKDGPQSVENILDRDLFEPGGLMHQLDKALHGTETPNQLEVPMGGDDDVEEFRELDHDISSHSTRSTGTSADYQLMDAAEHLGTSSTSKLPKKGSLAYLCSLTQCNSEMTKLMKLAIPYSLASTTGSIFSLLTVAAIGKLLGTFELTAYLTVSYLVSMTTMFLGGIMPSLTALCSHAIGAENYHLAGQYTQIAIILYELLFLPQAYFWWYFTKTGMLWMGFAEQEAEIAQSYARIYVVASTVSAPHNGFAYLLGVSGYEKICTLSSCLHSVADFFAVVGVLRCMDVPTLQTVGIAHMLVDIFFFIGKLVYMRFREWWWKQYWPGIVGNFAIFNFQAVKRFIEAAVPLSFGYVLSYAEWEVLFIMATHLGPAEVAAWGILGQIWSALESLTYAWSYAAAIRCAQLLGAGDADGAELSAHRSMALGTIGAMLASLGLLSFSGHMAGWITSDETLKAMVGELIPFLCFGNISLALGTISYALVGAQTRYSLATAVQFFGSWLLTIPLAALSSFYLRWDLQGLVAAVVIGCMVSGMLNFVILCCTDWERRTAKIMAKNIAVDDDSDCLARADILLDTGDPEHHMATKAFAQTTSVDDDVEFLPLPAVPLPTLAYNTQSDCKMEECESKNIVAGMEASKSETGDEIKTEGNEALAGGIHDNANKAETRVESKTNECGSDADYGAIAQQDVPIGSSVSIDIDASTIPSETVTVDFRPLPLPSLVKVVVENKSETRDDIKTDEEATIASTIEKDKAETVDFRPLPFLSLVKMVVENKSETRDDIKTEEYEAKTSVSTKEEDKAESLVERKSEELESLEGCGALAQHKVPNVSFEAISNDGSKGPSELLQVNGLVEVRPWPVLSFIEMVVKSRPETRVESKLEECDSKTFLASAERRSETKDEIKTEGYKVRNGTDVLVEHKAETRAETKTKDCEEKEGSGASSRSGDIETSEPIEVDGLLEFLPWAFLSLIQMVVENKSETSVESQIDDIKSETGHFGMAESKSEAEKGIKGGDYEVATCVDILEEREAETRAESKTNECEAEAGSGASAGSVDNASIIPSEPSDVDECRPSPTPPLPMLLVESISEMQVERKTEECDLVPGVVGLAYNESEIQVEIKGGCYEAATDAGILEESKAEARVESKAKECEAEAGHGATSAPVDIDASTIPSEPRDVDGCVEFEPYN